MIARLIVGAVKLSLFVTDVAYVALASNEGDRDLFRASKALGRPMSWMQKSRVVMLRRASADFIRLRGGTGSSNGADRATK